MNAQSFKVQKIPGFGFGVVVSIGSTDYMIELTKTEEQAKQIAEELYKQEKAKT